MALTYHDGIRGNIGQTVTITGADGTPRNGVIPARVITDASGNIITSLGGGSTAQGASGTGVTGGLAFGLAATASPTETTGNVYPVSLDLHGGLRVLVMNPDGTASDPTASSPVSIDQTTNGTTNKVNIDASLKASGTPTKANVAGSASSVTILASNANRKGATISNDSTAILYLDLTGGTASATSYTIALAGIGSGVAAYYEIPFGYVGAITGLWVSATGSARVTEFV